MAPTVVFEGVEVLLPPSAGSNCVVSAAAGGLRITLQNFTGDITFRKSAAESAGAGVSGTSSSDGKGIKGEEEITKSSSYDEEDEMMVTSQDLQEACQLRMAPFSASPQPSYLESAVCKQNFPNKTLFHAIKKEGLHAHAHPPSKTATLTPTPMNELLTPPEKKFKLAKKGEGTTPKVLEEASMAAAVTTTAASAPLGRWAHSAALVDKGRMIIVGGQADSEALGDVLVYDLVSGKWSKPFVNSNERTRRSWHSSVFLPDKGQLLLFGGERVVADLTETLADAYVLDTSLMLLYEPAISGRAPTARSGHTCSVLGNKVMLFGGCRGGKWHANVSVMDTARWHWLSPPAISGNPPAPRSYHSATTVMDKGASVVVFGGNNAKDTFNDVVVLRADRPEWCWERPCIVGTPPCPRTGHVAVLLEDGYSILVQGGWDPDVSERPFSDAFVLNTRLWEWSRAPNSFSTSGIPPRVGHTGILACGSGTCWGCPAPAAEDQDQDQHQSKRQRHQPRVILFGGQDDEGNRRNDLIELDVSDFVASSSSAGQAAPESEAAVVKAIQSQ